MSKKDYMIVFRQDFDEDVCVIKRGKKSKYVGKICYSTDLKYPIVMWNTSANYILYYVRLIKKDLKAPFCNMNEETLKGHLIAQMEQLNDASINGIIFDNGLVPFAVKKYGQDIYKVIKEYNFGIHFTEKCNTTLESLKAFIEYNDIKYITWKCGDEVYISAKNNLLELISATIMNEYCDTRIPMKQDKAYSKVTKEGFCTLAYFLHSYLYSCKKPFLPYTIQNIYDHFAVQNTMPHVPIKWLSSLSEQFTKNNLKAHINKLNIKKDEQPPIEQGFDKIIKTIKKVIAEAQQSSNSRGRKDEIHIHNKFKSTYELLKIPKIILTDVLNGNYDAGLYSDLGTLNIMNDISINFKPQYTITKDNIDMAIWFWGILFIKFNTYISCEKEIQLYLDSLVGGDKHETKIFFTFFKLAEEFDNASKEGFYEGSV